MFKESTFYENWSRRLTVTAEKTHKKDAILKLEGNKNILTCPSLHLCTKYCTLVPNFMTTCAEGGRNCETDRQTHGQNNVLFRLVNKAVHFSFSITFL